LRSDEEKYPAIFVFFLAIALSVCITDSKIITLIGVTACTSGDAFACFVGKTFPNSTEIRKGKTYAGFLGAAIATS